MLSRCICSENLRSLILFIGSIPEISSSCNSYRSTSFQKEFIGYIVSRRTWHDYLRRNRYCRRGFRTYYFWYKVSAVCLSEYLFDIISRESSTCFFKRVLFEVSEFCETLVYSISWSSDICIYRMIERSEILTFRERNTLSQSLDPTYGLFESDTSLIWMILEYIGEYILNRRGGERVDSSDEERG